MFIPIISNIILVSLYSIVLKQLFSENIFDLSISIESMHIFLIFLNIYSIISK